MGITNQRGLEGNRYRRCILAPAPAIAHIRAITNEKRIVVIEPPSRVSARRITQTAKSLSGNA